MALLPRRFFDQVDYLIDIERFRQIFEGAALAGGYCMLEVRMRRYHDHRQVGTGAAQAVEQCRAIHAWHAHVGYQDIRCFRFDRVQQVLATLETARIDIGP
jgi:hypothetical protein